MIVSSEQSRAEPLPLLNSPFTTPFTTYIKCVTLYIGLRSLPHTNINITIRANSCSPIFCHYCMRMRFLWIFKISVRNPDDICRISIIVVRWRTRIAKSWVIPPVTKIHVDVERLKCQTYKVIVAVAVELTLKASEVIYLIKAVNITKFDCKFLEFFKTFKIASK